MSVSKESKAPLKNRSERRECKEHGAPQGDLLRGAQEPRPIKQIGEVPSTARRRNRAVPQEDLLRGAQ